MKESFTKSQLLELVNKLMHPKEYGLSESEGDEVLRAFCAGCPDPVKARWLIVECLDPMTDDELVDRALVMSPYQPDLDV